MLYLKDYASYIKDCLVTELTDLSRNMMLSIDIVPVPTDEAVREVETRLLGVETNITNWQRRQNANNNFSAVIPYDKDSAGAMCSWQSFGPSWVRWSMSAVRSSFCKTTSEISTRPR